ncbi:helix-turn-helix domain-containing protein [Hyphomonas sp.]|jgi:transposase|uniref:helix-turn-helix domain-containing protein n=1 Tax=Hyphomonas sp. TaxID=87 RepID=UPI0037C127C9
MSTWFKFDLTEAEIAVVLEDRHSHPNRSIRERMNVVWMLHNGTQREEAAKLANVSRSTVQRIVRTFRANRLDGVRNWDARGQVSEMEPFRDIICKSLEESPARTVAEAAERITELTGLERKPTQVRKFLKDMGFGWKRSRAVPVPPKKVWRSTHATSKSFSTTN